MVIFFALFLSDNKIARIFASQNVRFYDETGVSADSSHALTAVYIFKQVDVTIGDKMKTGERVIARSAPGRNVIGIVRGRERREDETEKSRLFYFLCFDDEELCKRMKGE